MAARKTPDTPDAGTPGTGTPGKGTPGAGTPGKGTPDAGTPGRGTPGRGTPAGETASTTRASDGGSRLGWIGLVVAAVLAAWQVVYAVTAPGVTDPELYAGVGLVVSLLLAVGAIVLGIVAIGQHAAQRWPATSALAVGIYAFIVSAATSLGALV